jgi:hypothetical protein
MAIIQHRRLNDSLINSYVDLVYLTHHFRHVRRSDPCDMIYAFLGLTIGTGSCRIEPDYSKPTAEVFFDVADTKVYDAIKKLKSKRAWTDCESIWALQSSNFLMLYRSTYTFDGLWRAHWHIVDMLKVLERRNSRKVDA